jgi:2-iminobutanoate/2-iminopropanoate deaminase
MNAFVENDCMVRDLPFRNGQKAIPMTPGDAATFHAGRETTGLSPESGRTSAANGRDLLREEEVYYNFRRLAKKVMQESSLRRSTMHATSGSGAPRPIGPYSPAVAAPGPFVFVSGQIPLDPATGVLSGGDIRGQTERVLANLDGVLRGQGLTRENVVKTTVFLCDLADFTAMNEVYAAFFGETRPARSTIGVAALPAGARIEIEAIACPRKL